MWKLVTPIAVLLAAAVVIGAAPPNPSPEGRWLTEKKSGIIEIFRCTAGGDTWCGKLAWFRIKPDDPNQQGLDLNNPAPERRGQPLCGLVFMTGFKATEPDGWGDGSVYDPDSGKTYRATMTLQPDGTLRLRGYIVVTLIGASEVWTRYTQPLPACPTR